METRHFDFVVIGGGSAGYAAARTARETFGNVAIIEAADKLGGLCILRGCMPSKTLIYSAEVLHLAKEGKKFGLKIGAAEMDMPALHRRKLDVIGEFADYRRDQLKADRFHLIRDRAFFVDQKTLESRGLRRTDHGGSFHDRDRIGGEHSGHTGAAGDSALDQRRCAGSRFPAGVSDRPRWRDRCL